MLTTTSLPDINNQIKVAEENIKELREKGHTLTRGLLSKEEVEAYKGKDPITNLLSAIKANNIASDAEIEEINKRVEAAVAESVKFAEESPWPGEDEVLKDVYVDKAYPFIVD